jgi:glycosyltransferase involved in cell wall biosynthesis
MRVLLLADDCNPQWASLPSVGYNATRAIAELVEAVVVTQVRNRQNLESAGLGKAQVRYVDSEYIARPMHKLAVLLRRGNDVGWNTAVALAYPSYLAFEWEAWKATRDELHSGAFDIVHRITPMSPTLPSPFAKWSPVPFVIGPLNGGLRWPQSFRHELAREREWLAVIRDVHRVLPYRKSTFSKAAAVLAAFQHTLDDLPATAKKCALNFPEVGIDPDLFYQTSRRRSDRQKVILFAGRLVPYKMPQVVVQAFADQPTLHSHRLVMVGDGPERSAIEKLIRNRGLEGRVELLGWKTQQEVAELMRGSDIFAFPSIRELGAGALLEAMACGLACVAVDYGGPSRLIDTERGIKVPLNTREQLARSFGLALVQLISDERLSARLGLAAREHAMRYYRWDAKARKTLAVYEWVLGRGPRPNFWNSFETA